MKHTPLILSGLILFTAAAQPAATAPSRREAIKPTPVVDAIAQAPKRKVLKELSAAMGRKQATARAAAEAHARQRGLATRLPLPDGGNATLVGLHHKHPLYLKPMNLEAARTISTDDVWPAGIFDSGSTGLNLNGTNSLIAMWDEGGVRSTQVALGTNRVWQGEPGSPLGLSPHSTAVAGTLVSSGYGNSHSRGMSFGGSLLFFDWEGDVAELVGAAPTNDFVLSNHSYGMICGWVRSGANWWWHGETTVSTNEDFMFGAYLDYTADIDRAVHAVEHVLPVWSAGNDRGEGPPVQPLVHRATQTSARASCASF